MLRSRFIGKPLLSAQAMLPIRIFLLLFFATLLAAVVQLGVLQVVFAKLGLAPDSVIWLLILAFLGGMVNLPILTLKAEAVPHEDIFRQAPAPFLRYLRIRPGKTVVAVNVGGCVVPVAFSLYLFLHSPLGSEDVLAAIALVTLVAHLSSALIPGIGVVMPLLLAPLTAALAASYLDAAHAAPLAYIGGAMGVLLGADILRLWEIGKSGEPAVSIGGAGSFDGIFLTGILAVLLT